MQQIRLQLLVWIAPLWSQRMRGRYARPLTIDPQDLSILQAIVRSRSHPWFQVERARLLLGVANGQRI